MRSTQYSPQEVGRYKSQSANQPFWLKEREIKSKLEWRDFHNEKWQSSGLYAQPPKQQKEWDLCPSLSLNHVQISWETN